jgi:putative transposase
MPWEIDEILAVTEQWGEVDRSHRKLAHRGSYTGRVWVSPSTVRRVLAAHGLVLPEPVSRDPVPRPGWPEWLEWAPNRIWCWDATHFTRARRVAFAIVDVVSRRWIDTLVSVEETSTQVQVLFDHALIIEGLANEITPERLELPLDDPSRPILLACSDNGPQMTSQATRAFLAGLAIAQRLGRPHTPADQAWIESLFGHVKAEWPHLEQIRDPAVLDTELTRVRDLYNGTRLHAGIGYVTPDDEHTGRGEVIRQARLEGLRRAHQQRVTYHRRNRNHHHPGDPA